MINENASEPKRLDQCVRDSTDVKSGNCSALSKFKNVVNVSGVLNKFVKEIGNSAIPAALNRFVSVSALLSFDDDDDDDDDAIFTLILLLIIFFPKQRRDEDARVFVAFLVATSVRENDFDVAGVVVVVIILYASFCF